VILTSAPPNDVLFLSRRPAAHAVFVFAMRERGLTVRVAADPVWLLDRAPAAPPALVFLDLVHPVRLASGVRAALEAMAGPTLVLALHDGRLDHLRGEITRVRFDGFCSARDWLPATPAVQIARIRCLHAVPSALPR